MPYFSYNKRFILIKELYLLIILELNKLLNIRELKEIK
jgi:hypothetical protein